MGPSIKAGDKKRAGPSSEKSGPAGKKQQKQPPQEAAQAPANDPPQQQKKGKKKSEIDDIFGLGSSTSSAAGTSDSKAEAELTGLTGEMKDIAERIKKAREEKEAREEKSAAPNPAEAPAVKQPKLKGNKDDIFGDVSNTHRKKTEEGYAIYSENELGLGNKGGDTDLCPFDCDCCF